MLFLLNILLACFKLFPRTFNFHLLKYSIVKHQFTYKYGKIPNLIKIHLDLIWKSKKETSLWQFRFDLLKYANSMLEIFALLCKKKFLSFHSHRTEAEPKSAVGKLLHPIIWKTLIIFENYFYGFIALVSNI